MSLKKHLEEFEKNFDESLDYKVSSKDVVTFNSDGNIKFFKEQYQNELAEKDKIIEKPEENDDQSSALGAMGLKPKIVH